MVLSAQSILVQRILECMLMCWWPIEIFLLI